VGRLGKLPTVKMPASTIPKDRETVYTVTFDLPEGPVTLKVRSDECILEAARREGLEVPSLCEQGWCITCAVKVLSGIIDQAASLRFYEQDRRAGFALICTGQPRSDLHLRPGATEEMRAHRDAHHLPVPRGTGTQQVTIRGGESA
jgi:ferredoxin